MATRSVPSTGKNATVAPISPSRNPAQEYLSAINDFLPTGFTANLDRYGRIYYTSHATQTTQWIPPTDNWDAGEWRLPYGWECAADAQGRIYYINHVEKYTTYDDPRLQGDDDSEQDLFPTPRDVTLHRDANIGFGFVAGSEKPVIVRFVNEDGPSAGKLLPSDLILRINGEDVEKAPRDHVIELVRSCKDTVTLTVCQPQSDNSNRKSAFLSAAKKAKLKNRPSRVRFADGVVVNGSGNVVDAGGTETSPSPFIPNVLKVFLENGQTKSFKYDGKTTVRDVMNSLREKLSIQAIEHFALVVEHVKSFKKNQLKILSLDETIAKIAARPGAQHLRCLLRVMFIPRDAFELLRRDPVAFDYFYMQCCNDVIDERFATELRCDVALRLAALQMQQHGLSSNVAAKISVKRLEKECGLDRFIPPSILEAMKHKELRRLLSHLIKVNNQQLSAPGQKKLTELQVKVHYLKILSELPTFGGRCFNVTIPENKSDGLVLISPKFGVSQISGTKTGSPVMLTELEAINEIIVAEIPDAFHSIEIHVKPPLNERFGFEAESSDDLDDMVQLLNGYHKLFLGVPLRVMVIDDNKDENKSPGEPPSYYGHHVVYSMPWSYPTELKAITIQLNDDVVRGTAEHYADFSQEPPPLTTSNPATPVATSPPAQVVTASTPQATEPSKPIPQDTTPTRTVSLEPSPSPTHVEVNLTGPVKTIPANNASLAPPDIVRNMKFIDDSTSSELDTPVAERALKRALQPELHNVREDVLRFRHDQDLVIIGTGINAPNEPDVVRRSTSRASSTAELAEKLSSLQHTPTTPNGGAFIWHHKMELGSDSEETDSVSTTPTDSPIHRAASHNSKTSTPVVSVNMGHRVANPPSTLFRSGSSFGLHSPDDVAKFGGESVQVYVDNVAEMEMRKRGDAAAGDHRQSVGSLYLDPDIIDLCQIPIPEEGEDLMEYSDIVEVPPTPFRDPLILFPGYETGIEHDVLADIEEDSPHHFQPNDTSAAIISDLIKTEKSTVSLDQALHELSSFISAMTIPDPDDEHPHLHRVTSEDIRMLVIPPPPSRTPNSRSTSKIASSPVEDSGQPGPSESVEHPPQKPPLPPKPKLIPPPPPPRNKSLERKKPIQTNVNGKSAYREEGELPSLIPSLVSPRLIQRSASGRTLNRGDIDDSEAFKECVSEINAQLSEIAIRRGTTSSESDLVSTTPSASEESTPVMWRKNPALNCKTNRKPPPVGGINPNATLPFALTKASPSHLKNRYRTRPPSREKIRKRLAAVRAQNENRENVINGHEDEEEEPSSVSDSTRHVSQVDIGSHSLSRPNSHSSHETDAEVLERVCDIISEIDWTLDSIRRPELTTPSLSNMRVAREQLVSEARRFVTASKTFVKSATVMLGCDTQLGSSEHDTVADHRGRPTSLTGHASYRHSLFHESLVRCTDLIGMMFHSATLVARYSPVTSEASRLVEGILLVAVAFRSTIQAAFRPSSNSGNASIQPENSLHDPAVKLLMSEATKLAASLTSLMRTIRSIEGVPPGTQSRTFDGEGDRQTEA